MKCTTLLLSLLVILLLSCEKKLDKRKEVGINTETDVQRVIRTGEPYCKTEYKCIKPVKVSGSNAKAIEIIIHGKEKASFVTYDANGNPVDLDSDYVLQVKARKNPASIDANVIPKE